MIQTIIFDLDGTLYEDERVYDRYAEELARFLAAPERGRFLGEWGAIKEGQAPARIGLGYDLAADRLFRHARGRIVSYFDWTGEHEEAADRADVGPVYGPDALFGGDRFNLGDRWGLLGSLAARYGVTTQQRDTAFLATRDFMGTPEGRLREERGLRPVLEALRRSGQRLIAMSNSPAATVDDVFGQLGVRDCIDLIISDAHKPRGLQEYLERQTEPESTLSVGDNYVNDIEPALEAGGWALYIDRHETGLGADWDRCERVPSIAAAHEWLLANLGVR